MNPYAIELSQELYAERLRDAEFCRSMFKNGTKSPARAITLPNISKAVASLSKKTTKRLRLTPSVFITR